MYKVEYLPTAKQQLMDAALYIASDLASPGAAENLLNTVDATVLRLADMAYRFSIYPSDFAIQHEIRFIPIRQYLLFYVVREESQTIEIWRFLHQLEQRERP